MVGLCLLSLGVVGIAWTFRSRDLFSQNSGSPIITNSPLSPDERVPDPSNFSSEQPHPCPFFVGGIFFVIVGAVIAIYYRK